VLPEVARWFSERTSTAADWPVGRLLEAKAAGGQTVAVVLPALDEEETVGRIVDVIRRQLVERHPLVDELLVVDSGSTDATVKVALEAGARVIAREDVLPDIAPVPGKGEVLWRGVAATTSELIAFVDSDLRDFTTAFVTGLLGPLLDDPAVQLVKATYDRAITVGGVEHISGGGRVTELVARPLIALHWPLLSGFVQPLGGEYAARRALLERLPFACGYGVELGLLVDALREVGLDALAQVDLARRKHRNSEVAKLGRMAAEILQVAERRLGRETPEPFLFTQYARRPGGYAAVVTDVTETERPPLTTIEAYRSRA
jgi:glucosyl-3-phosphoglycerate synthase